MSEHIKKFRHPLTHQEVKMDTRTGRIVGTSEPETRDGRPFAFATLELADQIRPILSGHSSEVVGAVLADLTAVWLTSHIVPDDPDATRDERHRLLARQVGLTQVLAAAMAAASDRRH